MAIPQSNTDDCLLDLTESVEDLQIPPKPPYPVQFIKNGMSGQQSQAPPKTQNQSDLLMTSSSILHLPPLKDLSNCNSHSTEMHKVSTASRRPSGLSFIGQRYSRAVIEDPSTGFCLRTCCRSWMAVLQLFIALRAILARFVFLALTLTLIITVVDAKEEAIYWMLCFLMLPLLADLCYSIGLVVAPRRVQDRTEKW